MSIDEEKTNSVQDAFIEASDWDEYDGNLLNFNAKKFVALIQENGWTFRNDQPDDEDDPDND